MLTNIPGNDWLFIMSYLDARSLLSLRQTSSPLLHLIDNNDTLWQHLLHTDFSVSPFKKDIFHNNYPSALMQLAVNYHKFSKLTISKQQYISKYILMENNIKKEQLFQEAYNHILSFGNYGIVIFSLPFLLTLFFHFSFLVWQLVSLSFILLGGGVISRAILQHASKVFDFHKATGMLLFHLFFIFTSLRLII